MIDFDDIDNWAPALEAALAAIVPDSIDRELRAARPEFVQDACDLLFELADRDAILDVTLAWLRRVTLAGYHGSRLTDEEIMSIRTTGLTPLEASARLGRLTRALSPHPNWGEVSGKLDEEVARHGSHNAAGRREGQVHLTLSRSGLTEGFDHYLTHGAEFDQHVAHALLGREGKELLAKDGKPSLIVLAVPGAAALDAAHPFFSVDDLRRRGDLPNIAGDFLEAWSYRLAYPGFQSRTLKVDCGMMFRTAMPPEWIVKIEEL